MAGQIQQDFGLQNHFDRVWNPELPKVPSMFQRAVVSAFVASSLILSPVNAAEQKITPVKGQAEEILSEK